MSDAFKKRQQPPEPSQTPLWLVVVGLCIALYSQTMKDQNIGMVVLLFGLAFSAVSLLYYFFRPRHGLPRRK
ncbi:hypothetical protein [Methylocystis bryophila]|uniref:Uncharacterized protein n=1 Tax=Methylocystis bryophila TaxID=655015 RepID=A0A1W6MVZ5_9HYPH|nr:hypothetical protein [Methylocystis bryophila]ARN81737.1 hypothetical protein B1812_12350 [Methylocystis bryophila]BDV37790.1 hypothetical protein DSM21852_10430 [Methylocystis bryophila]